MSSISRPNPASEHATSPGRRNLLRTASILVTGGALGQGLGGAANAAGSFGPRGGRAATPSHPRAAVPGFTAHDIKTSSGVTIHAVKGGKGPPVLLFHGAPLTHYTWHDVAPPLAEKFTVVAADLRGYGDSSKPKGCPITRTTRSVRWRSTRSR